VGGWVVVRGGWGGWVGVRGGGGVGGWLLEGEGGR
jgi:hypothetical protein